MTLHVSDEEPHRRQAGEASEPLLALAELLFGLLLLGHVTDGTPDPDEIALVVVPHLERRVHDSNGAIGANDPRVEFTGLGAREQALPQLLGAIPILWMEATHDIVDGRGEPLGIEPEDAVDLIGPFHVTCLEIPLPAAQVSQPLGVSEAGLTRPQLLFRPLELRDSSPEERQLLQHALVGFLGVGHGLPGSAARRIRRYLKALSAEDGVVRRPRISEWRSRPV